MRVHRKAFTLIEMLVVMGVFSALFGTVTLSLYAMFRTSDGLSEAVSEVVQQQRFAAQLRRDAHEALAAQVTSPQESPIAATLLRLSLADGRWFEYRLQETRIERHVRKGDAVLSIDSYSVWPVIDRGWILSDPTSGSLLTVYLHRQAGSVTSAKPQLPPLPVKAALSVACLRPGTDPQSATAP